MNYKRILALLVTMGSLLLGTSQVTGRQDESQSPQGTYSSAFTYQGQLRDAGGPVNGTCDLGFKLWDAASGGSQVGSTVTYEGVELEDGLFTARLDFGGVHDGSARWLEVAVRCPAGSGGYITLSPRQELTGAPAALSLALPFLADANLGGPLLWIENNGVGEAAGFESVGGIALWVEAPASEGVHVATAGQDGVRVVSAGGRGLAVSSAGWDGVYVGSAGSPSTAVPNALNNGFEVAGAQGHGLYVGRADGDGVSVNAAGWDGVYVFSAGVPSSNVPSGENNGFEVAGAQGHGLYVGRADGNGVSVNAAHGNGVNVSYAFADGVYVGMVGTPSTAVYSTDINGFEVGGAQGDGLYVGRADVVGVHVNSAGMNGVQVNGAQDNGVLVGMAGSAGVAVQHADEDGVQIFSAGSPSTAHSSPQHNGFEVAGAQGHGLFVGRADDTGVYVQSAGWNGMVVEEAGGDGVRATNTVYNALYGDTANAQGEWGLYTPDKVHAQNVTLQTLSLVAQVTGPDALSPGDVVAAAGVADPLPGSGAPLPLVRLAGSEASGVVGVVEGRLAFTSVPQPEDKEEEQRLELRSAEGTARPGDYVALTVLGVAQVKVDPDLAAINPGMRLTSSTGGRARALKTVVVEGLTLAESAPTIGIALTAPDEDGLAWVLVNPQ